MIVSSIVLLCGQPYVCPPVPGNALLEHIAAIPMAILRAAAALKVKPSSGAMYHSTCAWRVDIVV